MRRIWGILLFAAACTTGSPTAPHDMQSASGPDLATSSCAQTVDAYCAASGPCVRGTASAQMASSWCTNGMSASGAVTLQTCADSQTVVVANYADSANHYVYDASALVAVFTSLPHATDNLGCVAGPPTFAAPTGCGTPTTLCTGP